MSESNRYELARRLADGLHGTYGVLDARVWLRDGDTGDYLTIVSPSVTRSDQIITASAAELDARRALGLGVDARGELGYVEIPEWSSMKEDRRNAIVARINEAAQAMIGANSAATSEARPRILVADEDAALRRSVRAVLHVAGYDVVEAGDGSTAIDRARAEPPDLLLMSWLLPVIGGRDVARELKKDRTARQIPIVIMVTAAASMDDAVKALEAGVQDFMFKPFDFRELLARIGMQVRWRQLLGYDVAPTASVSVEAKTPEEAIGPERAHWEALLESKDYDSLLKEAMSAAELSEGRSQFEGAAEAYAAASQAAEGARRPELANRLQRLAGTMYLHLAEHSVETGKMQMGYVMSARMFLMAGNLTLARGAAERAASSGTGAGGA
jgi:CheY-like chemotaxis protein